MFLEARTSVLQIARLRRNNCIPAITVIPGVSEDVWCSNHTHIKKSNSLAYFYYLYGNLSTRFRLAGGSMRLVCRVNPASVNSIGEAISLVFRQVIGLLDVIVRSVKREGDESFCGIRRFPTLNQDFV